MKQTTVATSIILVALFGAHLHAAISGFVRNSGGAGVGGVAVKVIADTSQKTASASDGSFTLPISFLSTTSTGLPSENAGSIRISISHGAIKVLSPERRSLSVGLYAINGRQISFVKDFRTNSGATEVPLNIPVASQIYLLKATGKDFAGSARFLRTGTGIFTFSVTRGAQHSAALEKSAVAANIVLAAVPAAGYFTAVATAPDGMANLTITLGTIPAGTVTYSGNVFNSNSTGESTQKVYLTALSGASPISGTATATSEFNDIVANYCPTGAMTADQARALQDQFIYRTQFDVAGSQVAPLFTATEWTGRSAYTLTGTVTQTAGRKVFTVASYTTGNFAFPSVLTAPWAGLPASATPPLMLTVGNLTLKCIHVDPGKYLLGQPYFMIPSWQEDPPHMVTLTKGYYIAEIPITNGLLLAATGKNPGGAAAAAADIATADVTTFINAVKASNPGKIIRPPTSAELMVAFRAGASNPPLMEKNLPGNVTQFLVSAKSAPANGWGIYSWLIDNAWERSGDLPYSEHNDVVDPVHTAPACDFGGFGLDGYNLGEFEYLHSCTGGPQTSGGHVQERVVVEE